MAKLELDEGLVNQALSELDSATSELGSVDSEISSAINAILSARGIEYVDTSSIQKATGLSEGCNQLISNLKSGISERVEEIKKYNEDVDNTGILSRIFSTIGLLGTKLIEGFAKGGEEILDGFASAAGFLVGFVSKDTQDKIGEFVKKDHVGDYFDGLYKNELSGMVKASYAKEDGIAAKVFEVIGTAGAYTAALAVGGAVTGTAMKTSLAAGATVAGIGGLGAGTEVGLQSGKTYNEAFAQGVKTGVISAGTVVAVNYAIRGVAKAINHFKSGSGASSVANAADDAGRTASNMGDDAAKAASKGKTSAGAGAADDAANAADDAAKAASSKGNSGSSAAESSTDDFVSKYNKYKEAKKLFKEGKITKEEMDAARAAMKNAHPDSNINSSSSNASKAANTADDFMDDAAKAASKGKASTGAGAADDAAKAASKGKASTGAGAADDAAKAAGNMGDDAANAAGKGAKSESQFRKSGSSADTGNTSSNMGSDSTGKGASPK